MANENRQTDHKPGATNFFYLPVTIKESFELKKLPQRKRSKSVLNYSSAPESGDQDDDFRSMKYEEYEEDSFDEELRLNKDDL